MERIPVSFDHKGKKFTGYFTKLSGSGAGSNWQLYDDKNFYRGVLDLQEKRGWVFHEQKPELAYLVDYFADVVTAWYE